MRKSVLGYTYMIPFCNKCGLNSRCSWIALANLGLKQNIVSLSISTKVYCSFIYSLVLVFVYCNTVIALVDNNNLHRPSTISRIGKTNDKIYHFSQILS